MIESGLSPKITRTQPDKDHGYMCSFIAELIRAELLELACGVLWFALKLALHALAECLH